MIFDRHCSDEQLLAHVDGELLRCEEMRVTWHLRRCWYCRGRLQELELQAHAISKRFITPDGKWPVRIAEARAQFRQRQRQEELKAPHAASVSAARLPLRGAWRAAVLVVVPFVLCLAIAGTFWAGRNAVTPAAELIAKCDVEQGASESTTVHQVFEVEVRQTRPVRMERKDRLEVWSDRGSTRFASRLTSADGVLIHALWRPSSEQEYVLDPEVGTEPQIREPKTKRTFALSEMATTGLNLKTVETAFLRWLEYRDWRPIGLKSGLVQYVSADGALLRVGRCGSALCLTATRREGGITAEVVVEVNPANFLPRLQTIRLESSKQRVEFSLRLDRQESAHQAVFVPAVFAPTTAGLRLPDSAIRQRGATSSAPHFFKGDREAGALPADSALLNARTVEVFYALHRAHSCLGEPVEVIENASGRLTVRGLVSTVRRKEQILDALSELGDANWLSIEIRTLAELGTSAGNRTRESVAQSETDTSPVMAAGRSPAGQVTVMAAFGVYFERQIGGGRALTPAQRDEVAKRIAQFSNTAVSDLDALLREAWALRRLAERYPSTSLLSPQARWLLQRMVDDHLAKLRSQVAAVRSLLAPIWPEEPGAAVAPLVEGSGKSYDQAVLLVFDRAEHLHRAISAAFTGATSSRDDAGKAAAGTAAGPELQDESFGRLVGRLALFEREIESAQEAVRERFSGKTSSALNR